MEGVEERHGPRHDHEPARVVAVCIVVALVCVLAGFVVGVARGHAEGPHRPVTVRSTVVVGGGT